MKGKFTSEQRKAFEKYWKSLKGKTYEEIYGKKKSKILKEKRKQKLLEEYRDGMFRGFKKGCTPWNKNLTKETDERIKKYAKKLENRKIPEEIRKKLSESHKGKPSNFKGRKSPLKGKKLKNQIVVHHKNGNHFDDRQENKQRMTRSKHTKLHIKQGDIKPYGGFER